MFLTAENTKTYTAQGSFFLKGNQDQISRMAHCFTVYQKYRELSYDENKVYNLVYFQVLSLLDGKDENENAVQLKALLSNPHLKVNLLYIFNKHCKHHALCHTTA